MKRIYEYRRHLPHYQSDNKGIFVTFCTHHRWVLPAEARMIVLNACVWVNAKRFALRAARRDSDARSRSSSADPSL